MTDRRLKVFCTVAECLNFSTAAKMMGISQPAVTKHIASIEAEIGCALFLRIGRSLVITEKGLELLKIAERILAGYAEIDSLKN